MPVELKRNKARRLSIIVPTYNRPNFLRDCLESLSNQTSKDFEVIVVCNGSPPDVYEVLVDFEGLLPELKIIRIAENVWSWDDLSVFYKTVSKLGLDACVGKYVLFLSDDDTISKEFVSRVLSLFALNPDCVAVTGSPKNRDVVSGVVTSQENMEAYVKRPLFEDGRALALRHYSQRETDRDDLRDPGLGYVVLTSLYRDEGLQELIWLGYEAPQILGLLPHGIVGFDIDAIYYCGRHPDQARILLNGTPGMLRTYKNADREMDVQALRIWYSRFGVDWAQRLEALLKKKHQLRSNLRFVFKANGFDGPVTFTVSKMIRHPQVIKHVAKTDARETIFWILLPRALVFLFLQGCQRGAAALRLRIGYAKFGSR